MAAAPPGPAGQPGSAGPATPSVLDGHLANLAAALLPYRRSEELLARWGGELAHRLAAGGRLLVAGNGGSAAEAQHLTAELVGKLRDDRQPLSAIALHAETSALTAIANDYGYDHTFARQVRAHGRRDDILLLMSTSGTSTNLLTAARAAHEVGLRCWALTGPTPNPLADACHDALAIDSPDSQVVQELHLVSVHVLCEHVDRVLPAALAVAGERGLGGAVPAVGVAGGRGPGGAVAAVGAAGGPDRPVRAGVEVVLDGEADRQIEAG
ncbi:SIS domain-containing protein [Micromonospora sp. NBC_01412]|uniref:D-sedoheptulose-7-phosphate isomerase n=1 Tax=Micromonospora sp. NBC_01412 TaxID=2903590 RepID=UPI003247FAC0